jgi:hypothetical protein
VIGGPGSLGVGSGGLGVPAAALQGKSVAQRVGRGLGESRQEEGGPRDMEGRAGGGLSGGNPASEGTLGNMGPWGGCDISA